MKRLRAGLLALLAFVIGLMLLGRVAPVFAHAEYESSTPAIDEVVATAPAQVDVFYAQEMARRTGEYFLRVFNEQQTQVSQGDGTIDDADRKHMFTALPGDLPPGRYIVSWKNVSDEDADDDEGSFCFYIAVQPTAEQQAECAALADEEEGPTATAAAVAPTEGATVATATAGAAEPTATPGGTEAEDDDDGGSNTGLIIVAVVAGAAVVLAVVGGVAIWLRRTLQ
ncbi:MAG: copper resistance protein CopC [Dehalococcoidia bacterium]